MSDYSELIARAEQAQASVEPGLWDVEEQIDFGHEATYAVLDIERFREYRNNVHCGTDKALAVFIADAHNSLIPELVSALKEAQERLREADELLDAVAEVADNYRLIEDAQILEILRPTEDRS